MECTDSNVSIDKTSKNKVSAVGAEKVVTENGVKSNKSFKINQKILMKSPISVFSLYNVFIVQDHFPL